MSRAVRDLVLVGVALWIAFIVSSTLVAEHGVGGVVVAVVTAVLIAISCVQLIEQPWRE